MKPGAPASPPQQSGAMVFDRWLVQRNRNRHCEKIKETKFLINWSFEQLIERLTVIKRDFPIALHIGARHDSTLNRDLMTVGNTEDLYISDLAKNLLNNHTETTCVII